MHKWETLKIILIAIGVLVIVVFNAWLFTDKEPDLLDVPETEQAEQPVPDFASFENVDKRKDAFYAYLKPEVEKQNEYLLTLRHFIQTLQRQVSSGNTLTEKDLERVAWLAKEYRITKGLALPQQLDALLLKIDILPVDLVMAQAANESAWGTSRFAQQGYNFFGLWCFKRGCGFVPAARNDGAAHEVAKFPNLSRATYTYMRNLNRHYAYKELRQIRATLRKNQMTITGFALAEGLLNYSERGAAYVEELQSMIKYNQEYMSK
ncbi:glucosaminidase domain-containing protein [Alteromonas ponticola]|uniref:Mannosyl-glycoprotein endo-beta-N-acetylglucosamidase n=1 Tax=Alteromonas ponticola TaxID=2720613 RepID=A0ABX1R5I9_9ALTE|nr:glucosaminidase domain-containing protein [Alteromonas ponticola]NMH61043.1 mannosyl-glycoprotein endo-beta-N-acetylglucosamidase [Alteromonas ponticola]